MKHFLLVVACITIFSVSVKGQDEPVVKLFQAYIQDLNDLNKTQDFEGLMNYFHPDFRIELTYVGLTGKVSRKSRDLAQFASGLQDFASEETIELDLKVDKINGVVQGSKSATISATVNMDLKMNGQNAEKGGFMVNMVAVKSEDDQWKFVHSDQIRTVEERYAGTCLCYFYKRDNGYVTEVFYPTGLEYQKQLDVFKIQTKDQVKIITTKDRQYEWHSGGKLSAVYADNKKALGSAKGEKEAITLILKQLYQDSCLNFTTSLQ